MSQHRASWWLRLRRWLGFAPVPGEEYADATNGHIAGTLPDGTPIEFRSVELGDPVDPTRFYDTFDRAGALRVGWVQAGWNDSGPSGTPAPAIAPGPKGEGLLAVTFRHSAVIVELDDLEPGLYRDENDVVFYKVSSDPAAEQYFDRMGDPLWPSLHRLVGPYTLVAQRIVEPRACLTYWRSHGCGLAFGHAGPHVCDPCPEGCDLGYSDPEARANTARELELEADECSIHCGDEPLDGDRFYGSDVPDSLFDGYVPRP